jgi:hypothetical protein
MTEDEQIERWMGQPLTHREFNDFATALVVALDEHKIISLENVHQSFADALTRKKVDAAQPDEHLYFLQVWLTLLHKLASRIRPGKTVLP